MSSATHLPERMHCDSSTASIAHRIRRAHAVRSHMTFVYGLGHAAGEVNATCRRASGLRDKLLKKSARPRTPSAASPHVQIDEAMSASLARSRSAWSGWPASSSQSSSTRSTCSYALT